MLHLTDNQKLPPDLSTAKRYEAKLGTLLSTLNANSAKLLTPARALSVDEVMVKSYGRSILCHYMPAKPSKYGIKLWSICCACCGYSLAQDIYLGSSVESVGGRKVVTQLSEPYLDRGYVIYCDRFFSHLDLGAYLRSRRTGMVGTSASLHSHLTWPTWSPICIPSHGLRNSTYTNPISPSSQGKARNRRFHWKSQSVLVSGWTKSIARLTRKWYSLQTVSQQYQHLYRSSVTVRLFVMRSISIHAS